jgi:transposase
LSAYLPRIESVVDVESRTCPCCSGTLHRIGEDVSEGLDVVPAQVRVQVVRRPRYACRSCEEDVVQAPAPARLLVARREFDPTYLHLSPKANTGARAL